MKKSKNLVMSCFNGMSYTIKEDATIDDLTSLAQRREEQEYEVSWLSPQQIEVNSDGMVDDRMGIVTLK